MGDNMIKNDHASNFAFPTQNERINSTITTPRNMSIVPQLSSRPSTLPINVQHINQPILFTPNDFNKYFSSTPEMDDRLRGFTTPDLINALSTQSTTDEQPSPGSKLLVEMLSSHNRPNLPPINPFEHVSYRISSESDIQKHENIPTYSIDQSNSPIILRNRSISSSMNDNDSSNSTTASSPNSSIHPYLNGIKDELQYVPSMRTGDPKPELVKKEKKRERNRQAAQKCRTRKLTRIAELQKRVNELQGKNKGLTGIAECLKTDITKLEKQLQDHHSQGCTLMPGSML